MGRVARLLTGTGLGLVLSGGGARGLAHVGVLRALREHGLDIDIIMGTSMGSLVGAAASLEWEYDKFVEQARRLANTNPWFEITIPKLSLLAGRTIRQSLLRWFEDIQIEDTPIPFACVSANLSTGQVAVHQSGSLETWIRASTAVPGVFPPVILHDAVHVDGGVLNNMPTDLVRDNGAGFIIAVDVAATALPEDIDFRIARCEPSQHSAAKRPGAVVARLLPRRREPGYGAPQAMRRVDRAAARGHGPLELSPLPVDN